MQTRAHVHDKVVEPAARDDLAELADSDTAAAGKGPREELEAVVLCMAHADAQKHKEANQQASKQANKNEAVPIVHTRLGFLFSSG